MQQQKPLYEILVELDQWLDTVEQPVADGGVTHVKFLGLQLQLYSLFQEVPAFVLWECWCCYFLFYVKLQPAEENTVDIIKKNLLMQDSYTIISNSSLISSNSITLIFLLVQR